MDSDCYEIYITCSSAELEYKFLAVSNGFYKKHDSSQLFFNAEPKRLNSELL